MSLSVLTVAHHPVRTLLWIWFTVSYCCRMSTYIPWVIFEGVFFSHQRLGFLLTTRMSALEEDALPLPPACGRNYRESSHAARGFSFLEAPDSAWTRFHQHPYCAPRNLDIGFRFSSSFVTCHRLQDHTESTWLSWLSLALGSRFNLASFSLSHWPPWKRPHLRPQLPLEARLPLKGLKSGSWRAGSLVKRVCCFCRRRASSVCRTHVGGSQLPVTGREPQGSHPSFGLCGDTTPHTTLTHIS